MALGPTYKKYGGFSTPSNMKQSFSEQQSPGEGFNKVFDGVENLLKKTEDIYRQRNTLNMEEHLRDQLKGQGLGADSLDTTSIQRQFGNMVDVDQLDQVYRQEKQRMEMDAVNQGSTAANKILSKTGDPLQARSTLEKQLRDLNAPENLIDSTLQSWTDANAVRLQDAETEKKRQSEARLSAVLDDVSQGKTSEFAIETIVSGLPENEQPAERRRLRQAVEDEAQMTDQMREDRDFYTNLKQVEVQRTVDKHQNLVHELESQSAALQQDGIKGSSYKLAEQANSEIGGSAKNIIGNKLNSRIFRNMNSSDAGRFRALHEDLEARGISPKDADAITIQAFNSHYKGDGWFFNNMSRVDIGAAIETANRLADNVDMRGDISSELSRARQALSDAEADGQEKLLKFRQQLTQSGRDTMLRRPDVEGMEDIFTTAIQRAREARNNPGTVPQQSTNPSDPGGRNSKEIIQGYMDLDDARDNYPGDDSLDMGQGNYGADSEQTEEPNTGSIRNVQAGINNSGLGDNPLNKAIDRGVDNLISSYVPAAKGIIGAATTVPRAIGRGVSSGLSNALESSRNRYSGQTDIIRSQNETNARNKLNTVNQLSDDEMNAETGDPVQTAAKTRKIISKMDKGSLQLTDLKDDIKLTPKMNDYISQMGTNEEAIKKHVSRLKKESKTDQTKIINTLWIANPKLAEELAQLLGIG